MFALIESSPAPRQGHAWGPRVASFAVHAALIAAAMLATQRVVTLAPALIVEQNVPWDLPPRPDLPAAPGSPYLAAPPSVATIPAPSLDVPNVIPPPGTSEILPGPEPIPGPVIGSVPVGLPSGGHAPVDVRYVEDRPVMLAHPVLKYPEALRLAGIEGRVMVEVVLDTLGRAEPGSLRVTDSPNPLFDREAAAVVLGSRYRPGRVDGHAVRVRIQVPVAFTIRR